MKRTPTQALATIVALFFTMPLMAQYTENFETSSLTSSCNVVVNVDRTVAPADVITGLGSLNSNPPVNGSGTRDFSSPYLNITSGSLTVSFDYKLNEILIGQAVRTVQVGLQSTSGTFTPLGNLVLDKDNDPLTPVNFSGTYTVPNGVYRLVLRMGGSHGNGTVRIIIDNLTANAPTLYAGGCNISPNVLNDSYFTPMVPVFTGASVLNNDTDPEGQGFRTPVVTTPSPDGSVVFNPDGSFTFTPNAGFTGTSTSFVYTVTDNGFDAASGTGVVTINFVSLSPLPVKLTSFQGALNNGRSKLAWTVTENETGDRFEIEKSQDGRSFNTIGSVPVTNTVGKESYQFTESQVLTASAYYRLRVINRDGSTSFSKIIILHHDAKAGSNTITYLKNPVQTAISFNYNAAETGVAEVQVYNMAGMRVESFRIHVQKGTNAITRTVSGNFVAGTYIMEIISGSQRTTAKLIK